MQHLIPWWVQGPQKYAPGWVSVLTDSQTGAVEREFRVELEEKQHIIAALRWVQGPTYIHREFQGSKRTPALGGRVQGRAGGEAAHHCSS